MRRVGREAAALLAVLAVAAIASGFAHLFREAIFAVVEFLYDQKNATDGIKAANRIVPFVTIAAGVLLARVLNSRAQKKHAGHVGLHTVGNSARGEHPTVSLPGTLTRSVATLVACMPGTSLGRESAILEAGGAIGAFIGRLVPGGAPAVTTAGVAATFSAAYHAPFGAVAYVGGHLGVSRDKRSIAYALIASLFADWLTVEHLGGHPIFPGHSGTVGSMVVLGLVAFLPAIIGARLFVQLREFLPTWDVVKNHPRTTLAIAVIVSAATVAIAPLSAGNGMEALRHIAVGGSIAAASALGIGKLIAVSATLTAKAPGGVFTPTLAVCAGWVLATYVGLETLGVNLPGNHWDGILIGMAAGLSVGLHAPVLASVVVAEMSGQIGLVPFTAVAAFVAHRTVHAVDSAAEKRRIPVPHEQHDEDA
jgi:chloride channel protein, CIC family